MELGGCYKQKVHCSKLGVLCLVASHWLHCDSLSLTGLLPREEKKLLSSCCGGKVVAKVVSPCKAPLLRWHLQLSGRA